jgi:rSAM/selenodomain-associated transferase 1
MRGTILIMARAPRPGRCNTRLEPLLGPAGCAALQAVLIRHTAAWAVATGRPTLLAFDPLDAAPQIATLVPEPTVLFPQVDGDLGRRLEAAVAHVFEAHPGSLTVIGTDAPQLHAGHIDSLERALAAGRDACLVEAHDGGYAALALSRPIASAFALAPDAWGGPDVLERTLAALRRSGLSAATVGRVVDLDTPEDARRLAADPSCPLAVRAILVSGAPRAA